MRFSYVVVVFVIVVLVVVMVSAYVLTGGFHHSTSSSGSGGKVLLPDGSSYSIVSGQFSSVSFAVNSTSTIQGKLNSSEGVNIYVMTPAEFTHLTITLNVSGYEWSSGVVADQTIYNLDVTVPPGEWFLAFLPPTTALATGVSFYSDLTLSPS